MYERTLLLINSINFFANIGPYLNAQELTMKHSDCCRNIGLSKILTPCLSKLLPVLMDHASVAAPPGKHRMEGGKDGGGGHAVGPVTTNHYKTVLL